VSADEVVCHGTPTTDAVSDLSFAIRHPIGVLRASDVWGADGRHPRSEDVPLAGGLTDLFVDPRPSHIVRANPERRVTRNAG
jgi:hypothetical protein